MIVYQTDYDGVFVGETIAHPSPLEHDVWAIPRGCVEIAPPRFGAGQLARWTGTAWAIEDVPPPSSEPEPALPPPAATDVRAECARRMNALVSLYSPEERETWPIQVAEAEAVLAGDTTAVVMLGALAAARGLPLEVFAAAVLQTADSTKVATASLLAAQARMLAMAEIPADYTDDAWWVL